MTDGTARPPTRTFKPRRRKLGVTRQAAYSRLGERYGIAVEGPPCEFAAGAVLDIGFGYGAALIELARAEPDVRVIGVEVHTPGIANVLEAIERFGLEHVRVVEGDVLEFLPRIPPDSLAGVRIWFPDPWPKVRQQRRRLVRADLIDEFVSRLAPGGFVHLATDIADYAVQMHVVCDAHPELRGGPIERPVWRPVTGYERRGHTDGRAAVDLLYRRATRHVTANRHPGDPR